MRPRWGVAAKRDRWALVAASAAVREGGGGMGGGRGAGGRRGAGEGREAGGGRGPVGEVGRVRGGEGVLK